MQLHPFLATVSRPIFWDRDGTIYEPVTCTECKGVGELQVCPINPSERDYWERCDCCGGDGKTFEETTEDEIINPTKEN